MEKPHSHYDNLNVAQKAHESVIRAAYKTLMQQHHPDRNSGNEQAARRSVIINQAYYVLSDSARRENYDLHLAEQEQKYFEDELKRRQFAEDERNVAQATRAAQDKESAKAAKRDQAIRAAQAAKSARDARAAQAARNAQATQAAEAAKATRAAQAARDEQASQAAHARRALEIKEFLARPQTAQRRKPVLGIAAWLGYLFFLGFIIFGVLGNR